jgi:hypothetical protein
MQVSFCTAAQFVNIKWVHAVILHVGVCHTVDVCKYEAASVIRVINKKNHILLINLWHVLASLDCCHGFSYM